MRYQADVFHPVDYSRSSDVSEMWRKHLHVITSPLKTHDSSGRDLIVMQARDNVMSPLSLMYSPGGDTNISHVNQAVSTLSSVTILNKIHFSFK